MFSHQLPDLRALELLDAISRTGSITLAAGELGITQQAVSLRLRRLEQRVGRALVVRESRASRLTEDGRAVLELAGPVMAAARGMDAGLQRLLHAGESLTVAASLTIAEHFLPQWITAFARSGNDPRLVHSRATNTREVVRLVSDGDADLGFVEGNAPPQGLHHTFLAADELAVYVAPGHEWAARRRVSPWTLAATPLVTRESGSGCRQVLLATLQEHGVTNEHFAEPALELPSNTGVLEAAAADLAPAVISTRPAAGYVDDGRLVRVSVGDVTFHRALRAVWRGGAEPETKPARELLRVARGTPLVHR